MTAPYRVGVDGGGTSTRARIVSSDGSTVGEGRAGASALGQGIAPAWHNIQLAIARAAQSAVARDLPDVIDVIGVLRHCPLGIGLSGANNADWRAAFLAANPGYQQLVVDSDVYTALLGAHAGRPGAVVIAGTGSIAHALHPDGQRNTAGGWGFPSGDEGSGAYLGLRAVNLTQQALDGRCQPSALTHAVLRATGGTPAALLAWCCTAAQFEFAALAPVVFDCEATDPRAAQLLQDAVQAIDQLVIALDPQGTLPLAVRGTIAQRLQPRLCPAVLRRVVQSAGDAMDGALLLFQP
jgi:glucosamine kinase